MPPRREHPKRHEPNPDQGELFRIEVGTNGANDPDNFAIEVTSVEPVEGGYFPDEEPDKGRGSLLLYKISEEHGRRAEQTVNRRRGNRGKHTPNRHELGGLAVGDVFRDANGKNVIVKHSNYDEASRRYKQVQDSAAERSPALEYDAEHDNPQVDKTERPQLTSREKLLALWLSERAGFLPKTDGEKNTAISILSYPMSDHDTFDYLEETRIHSIKESRRAGSSRGDAGEDGARAVQSRVYEMGDYLEDAYQSLKKAEDMLDKVVQEGLPKHLATDIFGPEDPAYAVVVRYKDIKTFMRLETMPGFNILRSTEYRPAEWSTRDKHKIIEDPYTAQESSQEVEDHIESALAKMTVGELRAVLPKVIEDEKKRIGFWRNALSHVRGRWAPLARDLLNDDVS